jgi:hypothetical protein
MIKKQHVKSRNVCKVNFELGTEVEADEVFLISEVNGWQPVAFEKQKNGKWKLTQEFEPGRDYQFRYMMVRGGERSFENDDQADGHVPNEHGSENGLISC